MSEELHEELQDWLRPDGRAVSELGSEPKGYRDLMWCPYINEPAIIEYRDDRPHCVNCDGNFEASTHPFMGHIPKPR
jgi:hypothetical protein